MSREDDLWDVVFDGQSTPREVDGSASVYFKWGWNAETGEAIAWRLDGGPDGPPIHDWFLTEAWGRPPSFSAGDHLGIATETSATASEGGEVAITSYYGKPVPVGVVDWFKAAFPRHVVQAVELPATKPESETT